MQTARQPAPQPHLNPALTSAAAGQETVVVLDFGSQYSMLIARRVRECQVYCEILPHDTPWEQVRHLNLKGVILSGGPASVYDPGAPLAPSWVFDRGAPVLGICYGMQLMAHQLGGQVARGLHREYGHALLHLTDRDAPLFSGLPASLPVWMSHGDRIAELPPGFKAVAFTENSPIAVMANGGGMLGLQFHPEVVHTPQGKALLTNFLERMCGCRRTWTSANFIAESLAQIRGQVGGGRVLCALSGGVDSTVAATLVHRAIGDQLTCVFVDNGLLRQGEPEQVLDTFQRHLKLPVRAVDASERFLAQLSEVFDPEEKRRVIGETFIRVFEKEAAKLGATEFLAQGTLYPDVIESRSPESTASARIKTHHNVGGLPKTMRFRLVEPLRYLFKDEARQVGLALGLPREIVERQPFPGPGLAVRIIGPVTPERLAVLRACDAIVTGEIGASRLKHRPAQYFAVLTDTRSVGVMGDDRTYGYVAAVRAVASEDFMTADWARLPHSLLARISSRIVNEVPLVNRVVYDVTSKPPGTIEWE